MPISLTFWLILGLVEKPPIEKAPSNLAVVGRYIIEPDVFDILEKQNKGTSNEIQLTDAIASRIGKSNCFGYKFLGCLLRCLCDSLSVHCL